MPRLTELVAIGEIVGPFGLAGEVKAVSFTGDPRRFEGVTRVFLPGPEGQGIEREVVRVRTHKGQALLTLKGCRDRDAAKALARQYLYITADERLPLGEGEHYVTDLVGLAVELADGTLLGRLVEVIETGANDVYKVEGPEGRYFIPATREAIAEVDLAARRIRVHPLPGLLELRLPP